jgi:hypothetical protein
MTMTDSPGPDIGSRESGHVAASPLLPPTLRLDQEAGVRHLPKSRATEADAPRRDWTGSALVSPQHHCRET